MKRFPSFKIVVALGLVLLLQVGCHGHKTTAPSDPVSYLRTDHYACRAAADRSPDTTACAYLKAASYDGSHLKLTIRFRANCCPAFVNTVKVVDRSVEIALADTLAGCRCDCTYEDDFIFSCMSPGALALKFQAGGETCAFDTLISVRL
jgi:hypothetical protein